MNKEERFNLLCKLLKYCYERYNFEDIIYENITLDNVIEDLMQDYLR